MEENSRRYFEQLD